MGVYTKNDNRILLSIKTVQILKVKFILEINISVLMKFADRNFC